MSDSTDPPTPVPDSPMSSSRTRQYKFSTLCATVENPSQKDQYGSSSVPIYQTATFKGVDGQYDYTRSGNPTRSHLEHHIAKISSARHAMTVSSGMAALDVITRLLKPSDEVIAGDDLYGGTNRLLTYLKTHNGVVVFHVDTTDTKAVIPHLSEKTAMVLLESPTNPLLKIADLQEIILEVKARSPQAVIVVDNTMMSPYLQRPLELGADIVYDSGTKYLSGHHDLMAGVITCNRDDLAKQMAFVINSVGNALSPFDSFLLLRGTKTLAIRMDRQQASAMRVASYLDQLGFRVHYPGLANHPRRDVHEKLANGPGAVLSFITGDTAMSERIVGAARLWGISVSFGAVNSLISMPCLMSHASIDPATRAARGLPEDLIRLCVGIEDPDDLVEDLERALLEAGAITLTRDANGEEVYTRIGHAPGGPFGQALEKLTNDAIGLSLQPSGSQDEYLVSAPGKVILFGEHAVVHGVTAIAAAVDLRCYGHVVPRQDGKISLRLPDIDNTTVEWDIKDLPWDVVKPIAPGSEHPDTLDANLVSAITSTCIPPPLAANKRVIGSCIAFLYLYLSLATVESRPSITFTARSTLPIGAGLGSSASYSVCIATSILLLNSRISIPPEPAPTRPATSTADPGHVHVSHGGRRALPKPFADEVNKWAFVSEKVLHGTPSGVDNSVAVYGGALAFTRSGFGREGGLEGIQGFKSVRFLLTDSKVPRDTKSLVAGVSALKQEKPDLVGDILTSIQTISDEAQRALSDPELPRESLLSGLSGLIDENHAHLVTLGVSHPSLEAIRQITGAKQYNLHTKLTGAGGGGCAVTLIPDGFRDASVGALLSSLREAGFEPYLTNVGGSGLGVLPSSSPLAQDVAGWESLSDKPLEEFSAWVEGRGRWLYV
ncbi:cystathionine beta-lyase [Clavulina sp. PMI_390]|nr:cystathionine beta-lyase [Clavulina sp. PMI_390]